MHEANSPTIAALKKSVAKKTFGNVHSSKVKVLRADSKGVREGSCKRNWGKGSPLGKKKIPKNEEKKKGKRAKCFSVWKPPSTQKHGKAVSKKALDKRLLKCAGSEKGAYLEPWVKKTLERNWR